MDEYIEREAAIRVVNGQSSLTMTRSGLIDSISKLPVADVAPVVHGRWLYVDTDTDQFFLCNRCKKKEYWESNYCPNCGAKMDGGANNEAD